MAPLLLVPPVVAVAMDARMGEIYVGAFRCTSTGDQDVAVRPVAVAPIAVLPAVQAAEQLAHWRAAGSVFVHCCFIYRASV